MNPKGFFGELKRRNVYKVAVAYAIVGWLLVQVATQVFPFLEIPNWIVRLVISLVAIGFPIALIIAWAFELTPEGIKRTEEVAPAASARQPRKRAWIVVVIAGAALSVGLFFFGRYSAQTLRQSEAATVSTVPQKLKACETGRMATTNEWQRFAAKAGIRVLAGDVADAEPDAEKARELLEARLHEHPQDFRALRALSWAYLALNRNTDAINIARRAVELLPLDKDAVLGSGNLAALAEIQTRTSATVEAVGNLKKLLSIPAGETVSIARLKIDPVWDPIRSDPGFQELLRGKELVGTAK